MADTAPRIAAVELHEAADLVDQKAHTLACLIKESKHFIVFTGAGISTSAGIPDFRGPDGAWTLRAQGRERTSKTTSTLQAIPTPTHMALVELQRRGFLKYVISQNCDGLHRRSGILPGNLSELHGNSNREYCKDCGKEYIRDFRAVATYEKSINDHRTGRKCALCSGDLLDTIINFGEQLPEKHIDLAFLNAKNADLCLALGSSLTVTPANEIPELVGKRKKAELVICNLQETPLDTLSSKLRIYSKTDDLMIRVMEKLSLPIPPFILQRRLILELNASRNQLTVSGVDVDGTPVTFLRTVKAEQFRRVARAEPFLINFRGGLDPGLQLKLELEFMGHYNEPNLEMSFVSHDGRDSRALYLLEYNPLTGDWKTSRDDCLAAINEQVREDLPDVSVIDLT